MADITETMRACDYVAMMQASVKGKPARTRANKYGAKRTTIDGETFDSAKESRTFLMLTMAMKAQSPSERVVDLKRSQKYLLIPPKGKERACRYVADFVVEYADGRVEVIDTKSAITRINPLYVVKRKLMLERFDIQIREM